jgi:hypothetical protein
VTARVGPRSDEAVRLLFATLQARLHTASSERSCAVSLLDVGTNQCRFIVDDGVVPALCCGGATPVNSSWCDSHLQIVYTPEGFQKMGGRLLARTN